MPSMDDEDILRHVRRIRRLARVLRAPSHLWEAEVCRRIRERFGKEPSPGMRRQLRERYLELVAAIDRDIAN
jgi:hypothetical protein